MALQDAMQAASARVQPAVPQAAAQPREMVALGPPAETAPAAPPEAPPEAPELTRPPLESASPFPSPLPSPSPSPSALVSASASPPARPPAEQGARAALAEARRSFTTALERLDAQLEPALAAALSRLPGQDAAAAAQSAASRMRSQPERALETQRKTQLPGVLGLLRWDFTPLSEPLPDALPARP
jgi:translation initiation factor IF-2